jgi:hypothetical protein
MPYTQVQFIAYEVDTSPTNVTWLNNEIVAGTYLGLATNDVQARCEIMLRAMQAAQANLPQTSPPTADGTTLKVFLAPEFFFRGPQGAYPMEDVQLAITLLQQMAGDDQWADWMFAFGTILGVSAQATGSPPTINPAALKEIYNFTLIQKGGVDSQGDTGARVVMKELKSGIDFIAQNANVGGMLVGEVEHLAPSNAGGPGREQQRVNYDGAGIFDLAGITWGVEICLDHLNSVQRLQHSPQMPGASQVQVQLVPSGGMSINAVSVIATAGGYVFNCDGMNGGTSDLQRVGTPMVRIGPPLRYAVSNAAMTFDNVSPIQVVQTTELFQGGAGRVALYAVQTLPAASVVGGTLTSLRWPASVDYQFQFDLIYDDAGKYKTLLCEPISRKTDFGNNNYFLPLVLRTRSKEAVAAASPYADVSIEMKLVAGTGGFAHAVWCKIDLPDFDFQGNAFQFNDTNAGLPPETIW